MWSHKQVNEIFENKLSKKLRRAFCMITKKSTTERQLRGGNEKNLLCTIYFIVQSIFKIKAVGEISLFYRCPIILYNVYLTCLMFHCSVRCPIVPSGVPLFRQVSHCCSGWCPIVLSGVPLFRLVSHCSVWCPIVPSGVPLLRLVSHCSVWCPIVPSGVPLFRLVSNCSIVLSKLQKDFFSLKEKLIIEDKHTRTLEDSGGGGGASLELQIYGLTAPQIFIYSCIYLYISIYIVFIEIYYSTQQTWAYSTLIDFSQTSYLIHCSTRTLEGPLMTPLLSGGGQIKTALSIYR